MKKAPKNTSNQPTNQPAVVPAVVPVIEPVVEPTPAPAPALAADQTFQSTLTGIYGQMIERLNYFGELLKYPVEDNLRLKVWQIEEARKTLKAISGFTVSLVTATAHKEITDQLFQTAVETLKNTNWKPTELIREIEGWPSWNEMAGKANSSFNPQVIRRLLVMNGLRFEFSAKVEREKKTGNPWGSTLKSFKAWIVSTDTPSLSIWDRLVPSVDKIPQDTAGLDKLKKAYTSLKDLGF